MPLRAWTDSLKGLNDPCGLSVRLRRLAVYARNMRVRLQAFLGFAGALAVFGLAVWAFVEAVKAEPAVVGSIGVAVVGALGVVWQQRQSEGARLREAHRDRMTPIYYELLGTIFQKIGAAEDGTTDSETEAFFRDLKARQLMLGASSEMVIAFNDWQQRTAELHEQGDDAGAVMAWEDLLRAIRKDLGHRDADLAQGELLRLFITDYDEHFQPTAR